MYIRHTLVQTFVQAPVYTMYIRHTLVQTLVQALCTSITDYLNTGDSENDKQLLTSRTY